MSIDQLPADFAPYHVVRTDLPRAQCCGRFYKALDAVNSARSIRTLIPEYAFSILFDGGELSHADEEKILLIERRRAQREGQAERQQPSLRILRKAA